MTKLLKIINNKKQDLSALYRKLFEQKPRKAVMVVEEDKDSNTMPDFPELWIC